MAHHSLMRKLLVSYCALISGLLVVLGLTIIPAQLRQMSDELDEKIGWAAAILAQDPQIAAALAAGESDPALSGRLGALMDGSSALDYIVVARADGVRIYHPDPDSIGERFVGGDEADILRGAAPYVTTGQGQNVMQRRAFHAVERDGEVLGFVMVSTSVETIEAHRRQTLAQFGLIFAAASGAGLLLAYLIARGIRRELLGYEPEAFANLYLQGEQALRASTHEFLNKLHVISGLLQIGEVPQAIAYIDGVTSETQDGQATILRLVENRTVAALLLGKASRARELDIQFSLRRDSSLHSHSAYLDTRDLVTVIGNLIENAFDAVKDQPELRQVGVFIGESERGLTITVDDTGCGMTDAQIKAVSSGPFTTKGAGHGTGLRLIRQIVQKSGGYLEIESEPGEGSSFTVSFDEERKGDSHDQNRYR